MPKASLPIWGNVQEHYASLSRLGEFPINVDSVATIASKTKTLINILGWLLWQWAEPRNWVLHSTGISWGLSWRKRSKTSIRIWKRKTAILGLSNLDTPRSQPILRNKSLLIKCPLIDFQLIHVNWELDLYNKNEPKGLIGESEHLERWIRRS